MKNKIFLTLILSVFMVSGASAISEDTLPTDQSNSDDLNFEQGELTKVGLFDRLTNSVFSFSQVQPSYEQGERAEIRVEATFDEKFTTDGAEKIVNIYHCADTGCDSPPPIESSSEDPCDTSREWFPEYDDCIAHHSEGFSSSQTEYVNAFWEWGVEFDAPQETGQYILVGYVFDDEKGIVSDISEEKFIVEEKTTDSDGDGVIDSVDQCPNTAGEKDNGCPLDSDGDGVINDNDECPNEAGPESNDGCPVEQEDPQPQIEEVDGNIPVQKSNQDEVMTTVELTNIGEGDMTEEHVVEMQVNEKGTGVLSFFSFTDYDDQVCDPQNNQAVHETFKLDSGDERTKILTVPVENLEEGKTYDVWIVTRSSCYDSGSNEPVEPFGTGFKADTISVEDTSNPGDGDIDNDGTININDNDIDGDGILNSKDECPEKAGVASNNGCPEDNSLPLIPLAAFLMLSGIGVLAVIRYG